MEIENIIPIGKQNAVHLSELMEKSNMKEHSVKQAIRELRSNGVEILSGKEGYWIAGNDAERIQFIKMMRQQAFSRLTSIKAISGKLKEFKGQLELNEFMDPMGDL